MADAKEPGVAVRDVMKVVSIDMDGTYTVRLRGNVLHMSRNDTAKYLIENHDKVELAYDIDDKSGEKFKLKLEPDLKEFDAWDDEEWNACTRGLMELLVKGITCVAVVDGFVYENIDRARNALHPGCRLGQLVYRPDIREWILEKDTVLQPLPGIVEVV